MKKNPYKPYVAPSMTEYEVQIESVMQAVIGTSGSLSSDDQEDSDNVRAAAYRNTLWH